jgi:hypothetical protein
MFALTDPSANPNATRNPTQRHFAIQVAVAGQTATCVSSSLTLVMVHSLGSAASVWVINAHWHEMAWRYEHLCCTLRVLELSTFYLRLLACKGKHLV